MVGLFDSDDAPPVERATVVSGRYFGAVSHAVIGNCRSVRIVLRPRTYDRAD